MTKLCFILGDQLSDSLSSLAFIDKARDVVFLCEVADEATYVAHHPKKIAFIFSAMRHFANHLREQGYRVRYSTLDDPHNQGAFDKELVRIINEERIEAVHVTSPGEWRVLALFQQLQGQLDIPLSLHEDNRFLCTTDEFKAWAKGKKQLRMEYFYRLMRKKYQLLIDTDGQPVGGAWNYDADNRKNANRVTAFPPHLSHDVDVIIKEVIALVQARFGSHFGTIDPFDLAVTREGALREANHFLTHRLVHFGDYQDAMLKGEATLYHSKLSFYLNVGLLMPLEICQMAEQAYLEGRAPLNAVEGFIRQIIGWREYVRGIYWLYMPTYKALNFFGAKRPLPSFYWGEETDLFCVKEVVRQTATYSYSHHIQRLMVTGNFALLAGLDPAAVCEWYLAVYADAFEWVELPNTLGMALFADGGMMASKPYAASGKYIQRMSNFCKSCRYTPSETIGDNACPFNALYWNFLHTHRDKLLANARLQYVYMNWDKMGEDKQRAILERAQALLSPSHPNGILR